MADLTRAGMIKRVLRRLRVLARGQDPSAEDSEVVGEALDSVYHQLLNRSMIDFPPTAWPEEAQEPFTKIMVEEVGPYFGWPRAKTEGMRDKGERELAEQRSSGAQKPQPIEFDSY